MFALSKSVGGNLLACGTHELMQAARGNLAAGAE
jgi:hypothetical protein